MADNVDISLKLGTEADISSAISAGARAGAAFAAAAQAAVGGISLSTSASMRAFTTSSRQISSSADLSREIRNIGLTNGLIAQIATAAITRAGGNGGYGGWGGKPFAPIFPEPRRGNNGIIPYGGGAPYGAYTIHNGKAWTWNDEEGIYKEIKNINKNVGKLYTNDVKRLRGEGGGGGNGGNSSGSSGEINKPQMWRNVWGVLKYGLAAAKLTEAALSPIAEEHYGYMAAEYRSHTARSAQGFRQQRLDEYIATNNRRIAMENLALKVMGASAGAYIALGAASGSKLLAGIGTTIVPGAGTAAGAIGGAILGGVVGGVAGLVNSTILKEKNEKEKQKMEQQLKTLSESQKRYYANTLFKGQFSTSYQQAMADLGIGFTEEGIMNSSVTSLSFRGNLMRGKVGADQMATLAFMPNTLAAYTNGITDPHKLHEAYLADLAGLGDESLAASLAADAPGVGLGTWVGVQSGAYRHATNRFNMIALGLREYDANSVIGGYMSKHAQNVIDTQNANAAQMFLDAANAPKSFYNGPGISEQRKAEAQGIFDFAKQNVIEGSGKVYNFQIFIDGEMVKEQQMQVKDTVFEQGMSFMTGGI